MAISPFLKTLDRVVLVRESNKNTMHKHRRAKLVKTLPPVCTKTLFKLN